jgi:hypothetical protein
MDIRRYLLVANVATIRRSRIFEACGCRGRTAEGATLVCPAAREEPATSATATCWPAGWRLVCAVGLDHGEETKE